MDDVGLAIYVHWPFCVSKCPYCDFNSHVRAQVDQPRWRDGLVRELAFEAALTGDQPVSSIFFGGGTPSLMPPETVAAVIDAVHQHWRVLPGVEITLEANPSSVEAARFAGFAAAGVNRVSLGVQALDDGALKALGRAHGRVEALAALDVAQKTFDRVSFDLIYARPAQTPDQWAAELAEALTFGTEHLSLYQLTIEPQTRFAELHRRGLLKTPEEEAARTLWDVTAALTEAAGLPGYETSNHARSGAQSRHNLSYWTYGAYVGIGPGAHGRRRNSQGLLCATERAKKPEVWLADVEAKGASLTVERVLDAPERAQEALMMGLRLTDGVQDARFLAATGVALTAAVDPQALVDLQSWGLIVREEGRLALTAAGRPLLNAILARLVVND